MNSRYFFSGMGRGRWAWAWLPLLALVLVCFGGCESTPESNRTTTVEIDRAGRLLVAGQAVDLAFLPGAVEPGKIIIEAHPTVPLERVDEVIDHLRSNGFREIEYLPRQQDRTHGN